MNDGMCGQPCDVVDPLPARQIAIATLLGRCMLRLQRYELLLKQLIAVSDVAGHPAELQTVLAARQNSVARKTLGTLVKELTGSYLTSDASSDSNVADTPDEGAFWGRISFRLNLMAEHYPATLAALDELVTLRNDLVHHFLGRFPLADLDNCSSAETYLENSLATIDGHWETLKTWAQGMDVARNELVKLINSPSFENMLRHGIMPDGSIDWPASSAVRILREAETGLAEGGWTQLNAAANWIRQQYPELQPRRYGCSSWRQVLHVSRLFETRKTCDETTGHGVVWYRRRV